MKSRLLSEGYRLNYLTTDQVLRVKMWLVVFLLGLIAFFFYDRKKHSYWKNLGVPTPKSDFLFGTIKNSVLGKQCLGLTYAKIYKSFSNAKFVGIYEFYRPRLLIIDPELVNKVLVSDFAYFPDRIPEPNKRSRLRQHVALLTGQKWKAVRTKLNHAFSSTKLKSMYDLVRSCAMLLESNIKEYASASDPIDIKEVMERYATDVIGACVFGMDFNTLTNRESTVWKISQKLLEKSPRATVFGLLKIFCPFLFQLLKLSDIPPEIEQFFVDLLRQTEEFRKNETNRRNDLMQLMLDIKNQELSDYKEKREVLFDENVLVSNMFVFFSSGFETTSATLACCLLEIAFNQQIQEKLRAEIKKESDLFGGTIPFDQLQKLPYLEMVLSETLRKHNPIFLIPRTCVKDYQIPGTTVVLKPGTSILIPIHGFHHDERYFPDPEKFDPERFSEQNAHRINPYTYLPFSNGPRVCIGLRFTKLEAKACLSTLLMKYKFNTCDKTEKCIQVHPRSVLNSPAKPIYLQVTEI